MRSEDIDDILRHLIERTERALPDWNQGRLAANMGGFYLILQQLKADAPAEEKPHA